MGGFAKLIGGLQDRRAVERGGRACILVKIYCQWSRCSRIRLWGSTPRRLARCWVKGGLGDCLSRHGAVCWKKIGGAPGLACRDDVMGRGRYLWVQQANKERSEMLRTAPNIWAAFTVSPGRALCKLSTHPLSPLHHGRGVRQRDMLFVQRPRLLHRCCRLLFP